MRVSRVGSRDSVQVERAAEHYIKSLPFFSKTTPGLMSVATTATPTGGIPVQGAKSNVSLEGPFQAFHHFFSFDRPPNPKGLCSMAKRSRERAGKGAPALVPASIHRSPERAQRSEIKVEPIGLGLVNPAPSCRFYRGNWPNNLPRRRSRNLATRPVRERLQHCTYSIYMETIN